MASVRILTQAKKKVGLEKRALLKESRLGNCRTRSTFARSKRHARSALGGNVRATAITAPPGDSLALNSRSLSCRPCPTSQPNFLWKSSSTILNFIRVSLPVHTGCAVTNSPDLPHPAWYIPAYIVGTGACHLPHPHPPQTQDQNPSENVGTAHERHPENAVCGAVYPV